MSLKISDWGEPSAGLSTQQVKYAIVMATAAITSYVLSQALHLSGSYWSVLSAVIVFRFDFGNTFGASRNRLLGTIAGAVLSVSLLFLARLWIIPEFLLLAAIIVPLSFLAALRPQYRTALVTSIIILSAVGSIATPLAVAVGRVLAVGLGAFIGGLFSFIFSFTKHPAVGQESAAKIIQGLGALLPLFHRPDDTGQTTQLQSNIYSGLCRFSSAAKLHFPEPSPIVRILTQIYWDIVFIGRVVLTTPNLDEKPSLQVAFEQVTMSFQHLCAQTAENLRQGKPLPTLVDFDKAYRYMESLRIDDPLPPGKGENTIVSLVYLLRQDFESLLVTLGAMTYSVGNSPKYHWTTPLRKCIQGL